MILIVVKRYYIIEAVHSGKCFDVEGNQMHSGANVIQYEPHGGDNQLWKIYKTPEGYYLFQSKSSGKFLDISGGLICDDTNIQVYDYNDTAAQKFTLASVLVDGKGYESSETTKENSNEFDPIWPCANTYTVTALYKYSSGSTHSCRFRYGIDIGAPYGEQVVAVEDGKVICSEYSTTSGFGNWIMIEHSNGKVSLYAHLSSRKVSVGDIVSKGQVIGAVGNTSAKYSIGAHLHFELGNSNTSGAAGDPYQEYYKTKYADKIVLIQAAKKYNQP